MGRIYTVSFTDVAVSAGQDLIEILVPSAGVIEILRVEVAQKSDYGDAASEGASWRLVRATGASGTGGSSATPAKHLDGDASSTCTCEVNNTTLATTRTTLIPRAFNVQAGDVWIPTPKEVIRVKAAHFFCVELIASPADAITTSASVTFEELW
jgi:hypothetical protein